MGTIIIKNIKDIIIKQEYIPTEEYYETIDNKEGFFREQFIKILKDNYDETVIKLIDLKVKYESMLPNKIKNEVDKSNILKNVITSNKNNKTHLLRRSEVDWYYYFDKTNSFDDKRAKRKPMPLPDKLDTYYEKGNKVYYAFYSYAIGDSMFSTVLNSFDEIKKHNEDYAMIDFNNIPYKKTNFIEKEKLSEKIGLIGEEYVYNYELKYLKDNNFKEKPVWVSKKNDSYGFDILSYRKNKDGSINEIYIEVKTTTGDIGNKFYVSKLELETSKKYPNFYVLYRVYYADDNSKINFKEYFGDISINEKFKKEEINKNFVFSIK